MYNHLPLISSVSGVIAHGENRSWHDEQSDCCSLLLANIARLRMHKIQTSVNAIPLGNCEKANACEYRES